jgi:hypothetical protein
VTAFGEDRPRAPEGIAERLRSGFPIRPSAQREPRLLGSTSQRPHAEQRRYLRQILSRLGHRRAQHQRRARALAPCYDNNRAAGFDGYPSASPSITS